MSLLSLLLKVAFRFITTKITTPQRKRERTRWTENELICKALIYLSTFNHLETFFIKIVHFFD